MPLLGSRQRLRLSRNPHTSLAPLCVCATEQNKHKGRAPRALCPRCLRLGRENLGRRARRSWALACALPGLRIKESLCQGCQCCQPDKPTRQALEWTSKAEGISCPEAPSFTALCRSSRECRQSYRTPGPLFLPLIVQIVGSSYSFLFHPTFLHFFAGLIPPRPCMSALKQQQEQHCPGMTTNPSVLPAALLGAKFQVGEIP